MILTASEVNDYIGTEPVGNTELTLVWEGVEALVKELTWREFEQQTLTDYLLDVDDANQFRLWLPDTPVRSADSAISVKPVSDRDADTGAVTFDDALDRDSYVVDKDRGVIQRLSAPFSRGPQKYGVSLMLGYSAAELADPSTLTDPKHQRDVRLLKATIGSLLQGEWIFRQGEDTRIDADGERLTITSGLTHSQRRGIELLKRRFVA